MCYNSPTPSGFLLPLHPSLMWDCCLPVGPSLCPKTPGLRENSILLGLLRLLEIVYSLTFLSQRIFLVVEDHLNKNFSLEILLPSNQSIPKKLVVSYQSASLRCNMLRLLQHSYQCKRSCNKPASLCSLSVYHVIVRTFSVVRTLLNTHSQLFVTALYNL